MFEISGMMVRPGSKYPKLVRLNTFIQSVNMIFFEFLTVLPILSGEADFGSKLECGQHFLSNTHIAAKHYNILFRRKKVLEMLNSIDELWVEAMKDESNRPIFELARKNTWRMTIIMCALFNGLLPLTIAMWAFTNLFLDPEGLSLPTKMWVILDPVKYFWLVSFQQLFIFHSALLSIGMSASLVRLITEQVSGQMQVLLNMLEKRLPGDDGSYRKSYKLHQNIIRLVAELNSLFAGQFCFEIIISSMQIALRGYTCIWGIRTKDVMVVTFFFLTVLTIMAPYIICSSGTIIKTQSEKIHRMTYQNQWYCEDIKTRQDLLIMSAVAIKPLQLNYRHFMSFTMEQFATLLQATYSCLTMIRHIEDL